MLFASNFKSSKRSNTLNELKEYEKTIENVVEDGYRMRMKDEF